MRTLQELVGRISALRKRLHEANVERRAPPAALVNYVDETAAVEHLLDTAANPDPSIPSVARTHRATRLIERCRAAVQQLRKMLDRALIHRGPEDGVFRLHRETAELADLLLHAVNSLPDSPAGQLRRCESLESLAGELDRRTEVLEACLGQREREARQVTQLADFLRALAAEEVSRPTALLPLVEAILDEVRHGAPLIFSHEPAVDPARFAAGHGLATARVLARLLVDDPEIGSDLPLALIVALVHDVGMARMPSALLAKTTPLTDEEARLIERHTLLAEPLARQLWPSGGWPVEALVEHHERLDGTGYPYGRQNRQIGPFTRLLSVVDALAAACSDRPHRDAVNPRAAITDILLQAERGLFDQRCAEQLLRLSFFPVGSVVELSDGAIAIVTGTHTDAQGLAHPSQPIVQLVRDANKHPVPVPRIIDLLLHDQRTVTRALPRDERYEVIGRRFPLLV